MVYLATELDLVAERYRVLVAQGRAPGTFYDFLTAEGYQVIRHPGADGRELLGVIERRRGWRGFRARLARFLRTGGRAGW